ncbi:MAG TPA: hypothetical protein VLF66_09605, partial [Thermoanaerobaculia bacterium]|nr:hypothetical protein [Thermoanaerobaculia bacterium]
MRKRLKLGLVLALVAALAAAYALTRGPAAPSPSPPGTVSFAVLGDAPYYLWENLQFRVVLADLEVHDLAWVIHVGDIFWRPCTDELYRRSLAWFDGLSHPVVYTPGDNEWTDCWEAGSGGLDPLDRLGRIREIFFADPTRSLGGRRITLATQGRRVAAEPAAEGEPPAFPELVENTRWQAHGMVFATVNLPGSRNAMEPFPLRTAAHDAAAARRTEGAAAWVRETFAVAAAAGAGAVAVAFHANPGLENQADSPYRQAYEPFVTAIEEEAERFDGPVLLLHGDDHVYLVDHALTRRTTGQRLPNVTRLQVPGSPRVGWVRVTVTPGPEPAFAFENRTLPRW